MITQIFPGLLRFSNDQRNQLFLCLNHSAFSGDTSVKRVLYIRAGGYIEHSKLSKFVTNELLIWNQK